ncbi:hypothetical protein BLOT_001531 [Blomia tropicalis]|nr:hypothetical protein BLOT_001531 [Blomia tropicalis]
MGMEKTFDLIVIGGGISGLSSVFHLLKNGFQGSIGLLEGQDRLGGRIYSRKTRVEEQKIEIGANWIHGIIDNPIYNILYSKQCLDPVSITSKSSYNTQAKTSDGKDVNSYWIHKVYEAYSSIFKRTELFFTNDEDVSNYHDSLGLYLQKEIDKWIETEVKDDSIKEIVKMLFRSFLKRETCISGSDSMDVVSLKNIGAYKELPGGNVTISKGYVCLIDSLLEDINSLCNKEDQFVIFKEHKVIKVNWPGLDNSNDSFKSVNGFNVKFDCENGNTFQSNHVIVTIPLGCLKADGATMFEPPLPNYKLSCIERMGFDVVDKIFLEYSSKSTISNIFTRDGVTTDEMFLLWNEDENNGSWYTKIYSIYYISDHCIQLWASGKEARILEGLSEDQVNDDITPQLRKFFKDPNFPRADNVIVTHWAMDPFCRGSYSYVAQNSSIQDIKQFAMPIYLNQNDSQPVIAFAGEATHDCYFSTVHGAFLSGEEVAKHFVNSTKS